MEILIINVALRPESPVKLFPIGLGYICTALDRAGYSFDLIDIDAHRFTDAEVERMATVKSYDVVLLGCIVTGYKMVKDLAKMIRANHPRATIIAGNSVATSIPETLLTRTEVDIGVMSEGEETIIELLDHLAEGQDWRATPGICYLEEGEVRLSIQRPLIADLSRHWTIDFNLLDTEVYVDASGTWVSDPLPMPREEVRCLPVNTARGCIWNCTFCYHVFKKRKYRYRSPESVLIEVGSLMDDWGINYVGFADELTFFSKGQTKDLVEGILAWDREFVWTATCRAGLFDSEEDVELMKKMSQAGCLGVGYSLESADPGILEAMHKKITVDDFSRQTELYHQAGVTVWTSLVFGYPQETPETIKATFDVCIANKIFPSAGFLLPQPGSVMYDYAREHGHIGEEEEYLIAMGDRQDLRVNMTTMSDEVFEKEVEKGLARCNDELKIGLELDSLLKTQFYRDGEGGEEDEG